MYLVDAGSDRLQEPIGPGGPEQCAGGPVTQFFSQDRFIGLLPRDVSQDVHHDAAAEQGKEGQVRSAAVGHPAECLLHGHGEVGRPAFFIGARLVRLQN